MVRCRPAGDGLLDEAMEEQSAGPGAPAVEAEGEFVEVVVEMLVLDAALMGSHQPSLKQCNPAHWALRSKEFPISKKVGILPKMISTRKTCKIPLWEL